MELRMGLDGAGMDWDGAKIDQGRNWKWTWDEAQKKAEMNLRTEQDGARVEQ